jgi:hypothetical protein
MEKRMRPLHEKLKIILIHGMAEKPPEPEWLALWRSILTTSAGIEDTAVRKALAADPEVFVSAYWADAIPHHVGEPPSRVKASHRAAEQVLALRRKWKSRMHISKDGWGDAELRRFGPAIIDALCLSLRLQPELRARNLAELRRFHTNPTIGERVHRPLEDRLREAWDAGCKVIIISHSLGSGIAYDALWRFSHRPEPELKRYRKRKVDLMVSMGSPLGDASVGEVLLCGRWFLERNSPDPLLRSRAWPHNIAAWHNYSAMGDLVCHGFDMEAQYFAPMRKDLKGYSKDDFRDYRRLFNPYREPGDIANPHKATGYLAQPKLAQQLCRFIRSLDVD